MTPCRTGHFADRESVIPCQNNLGVHQRQASPPPHSSAACEPLQPRNQSHKHAGCCNRDVSRVWVLPPCTPCNRSHLLGCIATNARGARAWAQGVPSSSSDIMFACTSCRASAAAAAVTKGSNGAVHPLLKNLPNKVSHREAGVRHLSHVRLQPSSAGFSASIHAQKLIESAAQLFETEMGLPPPLAPPAPPLCRLVPALC